MISQTAQADIEELWERGLNPSFADIVRLNAVGIKAERCNKPDLSLFHLRRAAFLGDGEERVVFRQPTLAHEIWRDKVRPVVAFEDLETSLGIDAFLCVTDAAALPDETDREAVRAAAQACCTRLGAFTREQIAAAVMYVKHGTAWMQDEDAPPKPGEMPPIDNETFSVALGTVLGGVAYGLNLTLADAGRLTRGQFAAMVDRRLRMEGAKSRKDVKNDAEDDYFRTLDEITARLKQEKEDGR